MLVTLFSSPVTNTFMLQTHIPISLKTTIKRKDFVIHNLLHTKSFEQYAHAGQKVLNNILTPAKKSSFEQLLDVNNYSAFAGTCVTVVL